jgi:hypothetical protein
MHTPYAGAVGMLGCEKRKTSQPISKSLCMISMPEHHLIKNQVTLNVFGSFLLSNNILKALSIVQLYQKEPLVQ